MATKLQHILAYPSILSVWVRMIPSLEIALHCILTKDLCTF